MVATSGTGWRLAPALVALVDEVDSAYPGRDTSADGSIGDQAHATRESDHNPGSGGYVHAVDVTHDPDAGFSGLRFVTHLVAVRDPRVKYLIHDGYVWRSYASNGHPAWSRQPYTGTSPHRHHVHVSILDGHEDDRSSWLDLSNGDDMPLNDTDKKWIRDEFARQLGPIVTITKDDGTTVKRSDIFAIVRRIARKLDA